MALSRDQILAAEDRPTIEVECPEWGGPVTLRTLSGAERDTWDRLVLRFQTSKDPTNLKASLVVLSAVNGNGEPMFTMQDMPTIQGKSSKAIERLFDAAHSLNALSDDDLDDIAGE